MKASDAKGVTCSVGSKLECNKGGYKSGHQRQAHEQAADLQQGCWKRQQDATNVMLRQVESMRVAVQQVKGSEPHEQTGPKAQQLQGDLADLQAHLKACQQAAEDCFLDAGTALSLGLPPAMSASVAGVNPSYGMSQDLGLPPSMYPSVQGPSRQDVVGLPSEMARSVANTNQTKNEAAGIFLEHLNKMTLLVEKCQSDLTALSQDSSSRQEFAIPIPGPAAFPNESVPDTESEDAKTTKQAATGIGHEKEDLETANCPKEESEDLTPCVIQQESEDLTPKDDSDTLRLHLRELDAAHPKCVLSVRKINRLGFDSRALLERHFAWYGVPSQVLVAHLRVKSSGRRPARTRPAGLGFVVMASESDAERVLAQGEKQTIGDVEILVSRFQRLIPGEKENSDEAR